MNLKINLEKDTIKNLAYRKVIYTDNQTQLVLMSIKPGDDIDRETHQNITQFVRIEKGSCVAYLADKQYRLKAGDAIIIPAGTEHYIKNTSNKTLKLYSLYSPAEHPKGLVQTSH